MSIVFFAIQISENQLKTPSIDWNRTFSNQACQTQEIDSDAFGTEIGKERIIDYSIK